MAESKATPAKETGQAPVEVFERDKEANIYQRLWLASGMIGQLEKDGSVAGGRGGSSPERTMYEYISHDLVTLTAKRAFQRYGIAVIPTVVTHEKDGNRTELVISVSFVNIDDPQDKVTVNSIGYGVDPSDKGPGKAWSYALKYAYLKVLMLNSADDIELDDVKHEPAGPTWKEAEQTRKGVAQTLQAWGESFRLALVNAKSLDEIKGLEKANKETLMDDNTPTVTRTYFIDLIQKRKKEFSE